ncbi:SH3 domain-containing protein [Rhizoctonia solani]|uniref:SH3 domain-containing protein n=1 Tax=Rhizoctonia solani TaxID=456999 RepID=A0A8H8P987_9AGAM|nr:SH3 domain-containing protein [Rhizoctonia solani]QRW27500.1 SH3 domain-containing protein [Rhizoctonia solani]
MSMLDKFRAGARKAQLQATAFMQEGGSRMQQESAALVRGFSLPGEAEKAAKILESFLGEQNNNNMNNRYLDPLTSPTNHNPIANPDHPESALNAIPKAVLQSARGLAVFQVIKAGFVFSGKAGSGIVLARLPDGSWSAPSCIGTAGVGWGLQIGADITDFVIVLNSEEAVRAFSMGGNVTIGGIFQLRLGQSGREVPSKRAWLALHPCLATPRVKVRLFAGLSLEGTILIERKDANRDFYGSDVPAKDILSGRVPPPEVAGKMYEVIEAAEGLDESGLPSSAYVPDATGAHQPVPQGGYTVGGQGQSTTVFDADQH